MARAATPRERVAAFVQSQLQAAKDRRYRIAHALVDAPLSDGARRRIVALHREMMPSAVSLMTELRHPDPALAAALVQGLINAAVQAMDAGAPPRRVMKLTVAAVLDGFGSYETPSTRAR